MPRVIITTVGTSLLGNIKRDQKIEKPSDQDLSNYLRHTDQVKASAETNSLSRLLAEGDEIVFVHSETDEGKRCAEMLGKHFEGNGYKVNLHKVRYLSYSESQFKMRGLCSLVGDLCELIRHERKAGKEVCINATGGFKAEIAYSTLVGLLFDAPVYYIHDAFQDIIEMPQTPISWDYALLAEHEKFFKWIFEVNRSHAEVEKQIQREQIPSEVRLLLTEMESHTILSPAGVAFYEAFLDRKEKVESVPIYLSSKGRDAFAAAEPSVKELFRRTMEKLRFMELRFSQSEHVKNSDCLVFPRGHRPERIFYFEEEDGRLMVCEFCRHGDNFEKLLNKGVNKADYHDFEIWVELVLKS